jgi:hypothetical protein
MPAPHASEGVMAATVGPVASLTSPATRIPRWLADVSVVVSITIVALLLTQWWSGLDTPDSEFYASLSIFTDQVTDRAPDDSYFWTRLGYIAPVHGLIAILGVWPGFAAFKALLLLIITASLFSLARSATSFWPATWLTAAAVSSSVVLSYLGNPYLTGAVMAGTAATIAIGRRIGVWRSIAAGITLGWLAMTYPSGALLAGTIWIGVFVYLWRTTALSVAQGIRQLLLVAVVTVATILAFIGVGMVLFPGLDWLGTYIESSRFDHSVYASGESVWLRDISLLVPASALVVAIGNRLRRGPSPAADTALVIIAAAIGFFLTFSIFHGEQFLEAPMLQAMLWPPALSAIVLVGASRVQDRPQGVLPLLVAFGGLILIVVAGAFDPNLPFLIGLALAIIVSLVVILTPARTLATLLALTLFFVTGQLLQNSRTTLSDFFLDPYTWAYQANPNEMKLRTAVNAQQWLIDKTTDDDRISLWVDGRWVDGDRELYSIAAMQLWGAGENLLTLAPTVDELGRARLESVQPSVIAMYGRSMDGILRFWSSIPREYDPSPPECYDAAWPIDPTSEFPATVSHTCLTRLGR